MRTRRNNDQPSRNWSVKREEWHEFCREFAAFCYIVGIRTVRCLHSLVRFTRWLWRPVAYGFRKGGEALLQLLTRRRRSKTLVTVTNLLAPVAALAVLLLTVGFWRGANYALSVTYGNTKIGYIANESVYANASVLVKDAVINADGSFAVEKHPQMQVVLLGDEAVLAEQEVCDRVLETMGDAVVTAAGLYVDGEFKGALPTAAAIQAHMNAILREQRSEKYDDVGFFAELEIVEGRYPSSAVTGDDMLAECLKELPIKMIKNVTTTEKAKYSTVYEADTTLPLGYEEVVRKGKDGKQRVHSQIIYVDGKERYRTVVSTEILQAPVDRVVRVGSQTYSDTSVIGDGVATGTFIWPLPYTKTISSPFASRWGSFHGAIDIANGSTMGKPIIATDGGTVIEADYHFSYGYYVLIDHGNGFKTRYAHCSKLEVKPGQKVAQGQYIAKVGNTGYSFGAHLHFEIIENGKLVDPLKYVQR